MPSSVSVDLREDVLEKSRPAEKGKRREGKKNDRDHSNSRQMKNSADCVRSSNRAASRHSPYFDKT